MFADKQMPGGGMEVLPVTSKVMIFAVGVKKPPEPEAAEDAARDEVQYRVGRTCALA